MSSRRSSRVALELQVSRWCNWGDQTYGRVLCYAEGEKLRARIWGQDSGIANEAFVFCALSWDRER